MKKIFLVSLLLVFLAGCAARFEFGVNNKHYGNGWIDGWKKGYNIGLKRGAKIIEPKAERELK